jgi:hypothetical protein
MFPLGRTPSVQNAIVERTDSALLRPGPRGSIKKNRQSLDKLVRHSYDFQNDATKQGSRFSSATRALRLRRQGQGTTRKWRCKPLKWLETDSQMAIRQFGSRRVSRSQCPIFTPRFGASLELRAEPLHRRAEVRE